jgi:uncharacterized membrane protein
VVVDEMQPEAELAGYLLEHTVCSSVGRPATVWRAAPSPDGRDWVHDPHRRRHQHHEQRMTGRRIGSRYLRATLLGAASGSRSSLGLAGLATAAPQGPWLARIATLAAAGELVGDKLPQTPARTEPPGLAARVLAGLACGVVVARRDRAGLPSTALAAVLGASAAFAATHAGSAWRGFAARRFGRDLPGALLEDAAALTTARVAATSG